METINLELNKTFDDIVKIEDWLFINEKVHYDYYEVGDTVKVENYKLPDNVRIIATVEKDGEYIAIMRSGSLEKIVETFLDDGKETKNIYIGFAPDGSDNMFPLFDRDKREYDIKYIAVEVEPEEEHMLEML